MSLPLIDWVSKKFYFVWIRFYVIYDSKDHFCWSNSSLFMEWTIWKHHEIRTQWNDIENWFYLKSKKKEMFIHINRFAHPHNFYLCMSMGFYLFTYFICITLFRCKYHTRPTSIWTDMLCLSSSHSLKGHLWIDVFFPHAFNQTFD